MVEDEYLHYADRRRGLDHDWFEHRSARTRPRLNWPGSEQLALWITVPLEFFPMDGVNAPFRPTGALDRPYPDFWSYAARDYGIRIGIYRIIKALDQRGIKATAVMNSAVMRRSPKLVDALVDRGWEIMCGGIDMGTLHYGGLEKATERDLIRQALHDVRGSGHEVIGWHSPGHSQSMDTMDLLAGEGVKYVADWVNDDLPYDVHTKSGTLVAMPVSYELSDRKIMVEHDRTMDDYTAMVFGAARQLRSESRDGARILALSVSPWIIGYHHRIAAFERLLDGVFEDGPVWSATGREIFDAYVAQRGPCDIDLK
jgi:allantoinase